MRQTGRINDAIECFQSVSQEVEYTQEHLYGFTCGLLPVIGNRQLEPIEELFLQGRYDLVAEQLDEAVLVDSELVLLISSLAMLKYTSRLYSLSQSLVDER